MESIDDAVRAYREALVPLLRESEAAARSGERGVLPTARELHGPILAEMARYGSEVWTTETVALQNTPSIRRPPDV